MIHQHRTIPAVTHPQIAEPSGVSQEQKIAARFWGRVEKTDGCWLWTGAQEGLGYLKRKGYGVLADPRMPSTRIKAHRLSYELSIGPIPDGLLVLHRCDNPPCVRPDHLFLGTHLDNALDMVAKGRCGTPSGPIGPTGPTGPRVKTIESVCAVCGAGFLAALPAKTCSDRCRVRAYRQRKAQEVEFSFVD